MKPLMYRQRPSYPALISALCVLIVGALLAFLGLDRYASGTGSMGMVWLTVYATLCVTVICVIMAFARYQFTHLWKQPDPAFSKKAQRKRDRGEL